MEVLGYYCAFAYKDSEDNFIISEGNWIIAYTYDATSELESDFDFHFLKYDGNKWSEKRGGNSVNIIGTAFPTIDQLKPYNSDVFCFEIGPASNTCIYATLIKQ